MSKTMGAPDINGKTMVEERIVEHYCTQSLVDKCHARIRSHEGGWHPDFIPQLLSTVFYDIVNKDTWHMIKKFKNPTINYKVLSRLTTQKIKEFKPQIFY